MNVQIEVEKNDKRLRDIQTDIQKLYNEDKRVSCISDEEILAYVKKYFMFNPMVSKEMHRQDDDDNLHETSVKKSNKDPHIHGVD